MMRRHLLLLAGAAVSPGVAQPAIARLPFTAGIPVAGAGELPLVEVPVARPALGAFAIVLSGDGGWRDLDRTIGGLLRDRGVPVLGWDVLSYFWHRRTPEELARDLGATIEAYATRWHTPRVVLVGYSFGADVLPFAYTRLPAATRARVAQISLLGLSRDADFVVSARALLGLRHQDALPTAPEFNAIDLSLLQCFYGEEEAGDSGCGALAGTPAEVIRTAGGHHFDGNYAALAARILEGLRRRLDTSG